MQTELTPAPGIYHIRLGEPERFTPDLLRSPTEIPLLEWGETLPRLTWKRTPRGFRVEHALGADEELFGFGLQLKAVAHKGGSKTLRVNADPVADSGDSHAPVPLFFSSRGYGMLFSTLRSISFRCGAGRNKRRSPDEKNVTTIDVEELYEKTKLREDSWLVADIPAAQGVDVYFFQAGSIGEAVALYNRFSGGGCMPALWGLGPQYRCFARYNQRQVLETARRLRETGIPCTMLGLEPGWQTHSYACSLKWDGDAFPAPAALARELDELGFSLSVWEHAYLSADSPLYERFENLSGEFEVWKGLVPDLATEEGAQLFTEHHQSELVARGVRGFKLDECDGSDFTGGWSFPDCTEFPSGLDGEQMHHALGLLYQKSVLAALGGLRTFSLARSSGAYAAPMPFALYSDLYGHEDFIRGMISSGYSGLLWAPEVRDAQSAADFLRRLETAVFSAFTLINGWYLETLPWEQWGVADRARELLRLRMALVPYLYAAYYEYHTRGIPPVRGLPCEYACDPVTHTVADEYLFGPSLLVAPMTAAQTARDVYLPAGEWYDFRTGAPVPCGWLRNVSGDIPVFVRGGTILPLAEPLETIRPDSRFTLTPACYGDCEAASCTLIEDDGYTNSTAFREIRLTARGLAADSFRYRMGELRTFPL